MFGSSIFIGFSYKETETVTAFTDNTNSDDEEPVIVRNRTDPKQVEQVFANVETVNIKPNSDALDFVVGVTESFALANYQPTRNEMLQTCLLPLDPNGRDLSVLEEKMGQAGTDFCQSRTNWVIPCFAGSMRAFATINQNWVLREAVETVKGDNIFGVETKSVRTVCANTTEETAEKTSALIFSNMLAVLGENVRGCFEETINFAATVDCKQTCVVLSIDRWKVSEALGSIRLDGDGGMLVPFYSNEAHPGVL